MCNKHDTASEMQKKMEDFTNYRLRVEELIKNDKEFQELLLTVTERHIVGVPESTFNILIDCFGNGVRPEYTLQELKDFCRKIINVVETVKHQLLEKMLMDIPIEDMPGGRMH